MLKLTEHTAIHTSKGEPEAILFNSTKELLKINFVKSHSKQDGFFRYSVHRSAGDFRIPLIAEYKNGERWIIIGHIDGDVSKLELPDWKNPQYLFGYKQEIN